VACACNNDYPRVHQGVHDCVHEKVGVKVSESCDRGAEASVESKIRLDRTNSPQNPDSLQFPLRIEGTKRHYPCPKQKTARIKYPKQWGHVWGESDQEVDYGRDNHANGHEDGFKYNICQYPGSLRTNVLFDFQHDKSIFCDFRNR
tara:strand:+ start:376 stop:813 length:438 start_codon:yes stop_codon:yes gene_type:complete